MTDTGDGVPASTKHVLEIISILQDAGITCCIVQIFALIYYGAPRVSDDRVLCVSDQDHQRAVELFKSRTGDLEACDPSPHCAPTSLNYKYPRFKSQGFMAFWVVVPESYCHIDCKPKNIEWSLGGLPYPKLHVLVQAAIDTKEGVELEDLIDGMNLTEEWGEDNIDLDGTTDTQWLENRHRAVCEDFRERGLDEMLIFLDPAPAFRREIWKHSVQNKKKRLGWERSPEKYATQYRKHGSPDPRTRNRPGL
ncbi:uncharacterized protein BDV14DRAFT_197900 [Aspergillus stella-maris]|uniref:uncharacterized protein n=1 Tax=Aspergillus stella-maris TaxID=1810926 RepID=UPI003CCD20D4